VAWGVLEEPEEDEAPQATAPNRTKAAMNGI
jgi:hypothetical protein